MAIKQLIESKRYSVKQEDSRHGLRPFMRKDLTPKGIYIYQHNGKLIIRADYKRQCPSRIQAWMTINLDNLQEAWWQFVSIINERVRLTVVEFIQLRQSWERMLVRYGV